jgi:hypothetical protein
VLTSGGVLLCASVLALAALLPVFRRPNARRSLTEGWLGEVITVTVVCTLALGVGFLGAGTIRAFQGGPDYLDLGLLSLVLLVSLLIWQKLDLRGRLRAIEKASRAASASVPPIVAVATSGTPQAATKAPDPRSHRPGPSKPTKRSRRAPSRRAA